MVNRGEVWWLETEDDKRRPVVVLSRNTVIPHVYDVLAVPLTTRIRGNSAEVVLEQEDGLPHRCAAQLDQLGAVPKALLTTRICELRITRMREICSALATATGCR